MDERYYTAPLAAMVRGYIMRTGAELDSSLVSKELSELNESELSALFEYGKSQGLKIYPFKRAKKVLPRVSKVLGFLRSIYFESLLDVGSGRLAFLLPFICEFPHIKVSSIDILDKRIEPLLDMQRGGMTSLSVQKASICDTPLPEKSVDVVTLLEVLEHIPNVTDAISSAVKIAKNYVVVTVPSKQDDNPEHIHLLTKEKLSKYFNECGVYKLSFDYVHEHLFMIGRI